MFSKRIGFVLMVLTASVLQAADLSLQACKDGAAKGDAEAAYQLAQRYEAGRDVRKDKFKALANYRKAADKGHRAACERMAALYETGTFVSKDEIQAARYRAMATGGNIERAVEQARTSVEKNKEDEIETALDYILGRHGKVKDAKTGIRILYAQAKDKPVAQRVFVDRWSKGDLDDALSALDAEEWNLIIPWFKDAWNRGMTDTGLVLGNAAYRQKRYREALNYWEKSGLAKCWYFVGRFYASWSKEGEGGGPESMKDETLSRKAYERCLRIDAGWDDAKFDLACLYVWADKKENLNYRKALDYFASLLKKNSSNKYYNYGYGCAGFWLNNDQLLRLENEYKYANATRRDAIKSEYDRVKRQRDGYLRYIRLAANNGHEGAQSFLKRLAE